MANKVRFHLTEDGPKNCTAQQGKCPYGSEPHFGSRAMAEAAYERKLEDEYGAFSISQKFPEDVPEKPEIPIPSWSEVQEVYESLLKDRKKKGAIPYSLTGKPIGYGLSGSTIYGLQVPTSDRDLTIITDLPKAPDFQHIFDDGEDVRISSIFSVSSRILDSSPQDVDMFSSKTFTLMDESLKPFIFSHRINTLSYRFKLESHLRSDVRNALSDERNPDRAKKSVKTALRNSVMALRAAESDGRFVRVEFNDEERVKFFRELRDLQEHVNSSMVDRAPLWNEVKTLREKASKDFGTIDSLKRDSYYKKLEKDLDSIDGKIFQRFSDAALRISG